MPGDPIQNLIGRLHAGQCSADEVRSLTRHSSAIVRANAIEALARLAATDDRTVGDLSQAALDPVNQARLIGTTSVAHVAVAGLLRIGTAAAEHKAHELIDDWPEPDRQDLLWNLPSEELLVGEASTRETR